jgi:hypothetical protein
MISTRNFLVALATLSFTADAQAEGSAEFDVGDTAASRAHDQELSLSAQL